MRRSLVLVLAALNAACFEARDPLGPPGPSLDETLIGAWECRPPSPEETERATLEIFRFDERQYLVVWSEDSKRDLYRAHPTRIGSRTILNTQEIEYGSLDGGWFFFRYAFEPAGGLRLSIVGDEAVGTKDSDAGRRVIRRRVADDALYTAFALCTKR